VNLQCPKSYGCERGKLLILNGKAKTLIIELDGALYVRDQIADAVKADDAQVVWHGGTG